VVRTADAVRGLIEDVLATRLQQGIVTATPGTKVTATIDGVAMTLPRLASYASPAIGHVVMIATTVSGSRIVIGAVA
jgi:hypothetical protein